MIERNAVMTFKDIAEKKFNLTIRDVKEEVTKTELNALMDYLITNKIVKTMSGDVVEKVSAKVVLKESENIDLE